MEIIKHYTIIKGQIYILKKHLDFFPSHILRSLASNGYERMSDLLAGDLPPKTELGWA